MGVTCTIWGTSAKYESPDSRNRVVIISPRAGGKYMINGTAQKIVGYWEESSKVLLTDWLVEQRKFGVTCPEITSNILDDVKYRRPLTIDGRTDNLLRYLRWNNNILGQVVKFYTLDNRKAQDAADELLAWTGSRKISEVVYLAEYCDQKDWIEHRETERSSSSGNNIHEIQLQPTGYARLTVLEESESQDGKMQKLQLNESPTNAILVNEQRRSGMPQKVFVVHGRDNSIKNDVARFIEKIGLEAIILHEQPNSGRTLITKFQDIASNVEFAVVLMTPDDEGGIIGKDKAPRARQNVIFELGFFIGKLGENKVCALVQGDIERPSDFDGVVYISYGERTGWKTELARELKESGVSFDADMLL